MQDLGFELRSSSGVMSITELPLDLVSHIALWLPDAPTLARMQWTSKLCRQACQPHAEKMRRLLKHSARMAKLLRCAEYHCPRPLDYQVLLRQQEAAENRDLSSRRFSGLRGEASYFGPLHTDLTLSVEVLYGDSSWAWCGPPKELIPQLSAPGLRRSQRTPIAARVWEERPAFIDELCKLTEESTEGYFTGSEVDVAWSKVRLRVFVTRGLRTIKIHDGNIVDGDEVKGSLTASDEVGCFERHGETMPCDVGASLTDDGAVGLVFTAWHFQGDDGTAHDEGFEFEGDIHAGDTPGVLQLLTAAAFLLEDDAHGDVYDDDLDEDDVDDDDDGGGDDDDDDADDDDDDDDDDENGV